MKIGQAFPSNYLKKEDVGDGLVLTIKDVKVEDVGGNNDPADMKPVIHFHEVDRGMTCNKTNAEIITHIMGSDDTDLWIGKQICLYNEPSIFFGGKMTGGIRVRPAQSMAQPAAQGASGVAQPPPQANPAQAAPPNPAPNFQNPSAAAATAQAGATNAPNPAFDDDIPFN